MAKGSNGRNSNKKTPQKSLSTFSDSDMDDEIDVFHKQRDIVPLNLDDDTAESDEDNEQPVFEIEGSDDDDDDDDDDDEEDEDEDEDEDETELTGLAAKIAKQHKSLKAKMGGAKDETQGDDEDEDKDEDKEKKSVAWGRGKNIYYDNDKGESSEDEEEAEVLRLQNEKTKLYSNADHGLEDDDSEEEPTFEDKSKKGKVLSKANVSHEDETDTGVEVVMKDPSALSKEEQMDIVYNSAPELVGLLSELNEAVDQLETKVDPILSKLKEEKNLNKSGIQYMELKKQLLLSYCQAITFHLLLKSEGHSVRDHPVLARLVEIKNLLDKMKPLDENIAFEAEEFLKNHTTTTMVDSISPNEITPNDSISLINNHKPTVESLETQKETKVETKTVDGGKRKRDNEQRGLQSVEMLKVRAALEEKLKQKGVFNLKTTKRTDGVNKNLKPLNGKLEARDDFDDDTFNIDGNQNKSRMSQLVTQIKKPRVISGDDDLPKRDDIGERRRKHETRVLASAGIQSDDDLQNDETTLEADGVDDDTNEDGERETESEADLYTETKIKRDAKLAAKAQKYSRTAPWVGMPETLVDGKRHINYEMEKNRGLTRKRNKDIKNPRKKYKLKHKKKEVARKGQVREHRKATGPYGGEGSGINTISRSIRFKS